jgi:hypothetical protein
MRRVLGETGKGDLAMRIFYGFCDPASKELTTHQTASDLCPVCKKPLGYNVRLVIREEDLKTPFHRDCLTKEQVETAAGKWVNCGRS